MRKLIWGCAAGGALVVCGAFAAAEHAVAHPQSIVGRALHGASHLAACANPYNGFAPALTRLQSASSVKKDEVAIDIEGLPAEPTPDVSVDASGPIEAPGEAPPIVIPEVERSAPSSGEVGSPVTEVPSSSEPAAPATMPLAADEPAVPVAAAVEPVRVEYRSWWHTMAGWFKMGPRCEADRGACEGGEIPAKPAAGGAECQEHSHHHSGCPYTGKCYSGYKGQPAAAVPVKAEEKDAKRPQGGEEASEPRERERSSALKAIRKIRSRVSIPQDRAPVGPAVDTMELRPSDLPLYDYGRGPL